MVLPDNLLSIVTGGISPLEMLNNIDKTNNMTVDQDGGFTDGASIYLFFGLTAE